MDQFTPGPWRANVQYVSAANGSAVPIASSHLEWFTAPGGPAHEEACANARLIAAAPDLLDIAKRWAAIDGGAWDVQRHAAEKRDLINDTQAAIAKVENY